MITLLALLACLQEKPPQETPPPPKPSDAVPVDISYKDGLNFKTRDGSFEGYISGFIRVHARTIFDRPDDTAAPLRTLPDAIWLRETRLETGGTILKEWAYRLQLDFNSGSTNQSTGAAASAVTGTLREGWAEWKPDRAFNIRLGQFYEPLSPEEFDSTRVMEFAERAPMNRLAPGRELGIEVYGRLLEDRLMYLVMASQGQGLLQDQGRGVTDSSDEKELAALLHVFPLENIRLSVGGTIGDVDDVAASGFDLITTELFALYLDSTAGTFDGLRMRADAAILAWLGPASLRAEYLYREDDLKNSPENTLESLGWFVTGTMFLTGEEKNPLKRVVPKRDWGALELAVRYSRLEVRNAFEAGISVPAGNSEQVAAVTVGLTWWHSKFLRVTLQGTHERFEDPLRFDNREEDSLTGLIARVQLEF